MVTSFQIKYNIVYQGVEFEELSNNYQGNAFQMVDLVRQNSIRYGSLNVEAVV